MIEFVGLVPFLRIIKGVTMHFHIANTNVLEKTFFNIQKVPLNLKGPRSAG